MEENITIFTICNFSTRRYVIISNDVAKELETDNLTNYPPPSTQQGMSDQRKFNRKIPTSGSIVLTPLPLRQNLDYIPGYKRYRIEMSMVQGDEETQIVLFLLCDRGPTRLLGDKN